MCSLASNKNGSSCQAEHHRIARQKQFNQVAVGTRVTPRAHRAMCAELRHTALASSHDAKRWFGYGWRTLIFGTWLSKRWSSLLGSYASADCAAARRAAMTGRPRPGRQTAVSGYPGRHGSSGIPEQHAATISQSRGSGHNDGASNASLFTDRSRAGE